MFFKVMSLSPVFTEHIYIYITETFSRHPYIIYTSLYFECFILILQTTHFLQYFYMFIKNRYVIVKPLNLSYKVTFLFYIFEVVSCCGGTALTSSAGASYLFGLKYEKAYYACSRFGWRLFRRLFSLIISSLFFLPLSRRRSDIDVNTVSKGR